MPDHAWLHKQSSLQANTHLMAAEIGPLTILEMQDCRVEKATSVNLLQEESGVSNKMITDTLEKQLVNPSKNTQTQDVQTGHLESLHTRPIIIDPETSSGYAEVLYAGCSGTNSVNETRDVRSQHVGVSFQNSLIVGQINVIRTESDNVENVYTSASANVLLDEAKTSQGTSSFEKSSPGVIYGTESDTKAVHVALARTHLASQSQTVAEAPDVVHQVVEESPNVDQMATDYSTGSTNTCVVSNRTSINNFVNTKANVQNSEIQSCHIDSSISKSMIVASNSANGEPECTSTLHSICRMRDGHSLNTERSGREPPISEDAAVESSNVETVVNTSHSIRNMRDSHVPNVKTSSQESQTLSLINEDTVESSNIETIADTTRGIYGQSIETQTFDMETVCVDVFCVAPAAVDNRADIQKAEAEPLSRSAAHAGDPSAAPEAGLDAEMQSLLMGSEAEAEAVDVETACDETGTLAWSSAETRGSTESVEDMEVDVEEGAEEADGEGPMAVPDEWCDACRQRFSPSADIAALSKRYRVAKWIGSLLEFMGLVSGDDPDCAPLELLGPPTMAAADSSSSPGRSRGGFFF